MTTTLQSGGDIFTALSAILGDPLSIVLVLLGALVIGAASLAFGGLSAGGLLGWFFRFAE